MSNTENRYKLTTVIESSDGTGVLQRVTVEEYSCDPAIHITKNMAVANGVMSAFGGLADQAKKALGAA